MNYPLVSIITVSYNAVSTIEETINSIINQTYINIEYIIIDGGSNDGTIEIIKRYANKISYWISEPDKGIYDAMNKGIKLAKGEWINFMNCGDTFYSASSIFDIMSLSLKESDVIYGNTNLVYKYGSLIKKGDVVKANNYMPFGHQAAFTKKNILKKYLFDTHYKICADRHLYYRIYRDKGTFEYINVTISNYDVETGISAINTKLFLTEIGEIEGKDNEFRWQLKCQVYLITNKLKIQIKKILPNHIVTLIKKRRTKILINKS